MASGWKVRIGSLMGVSLLAALGLSAAHSVAISSSRAPAAALAADRSPSGVSVTSDFNGDGFSDLAVGIPFEDVGTVRDAGGVSVLYGASGGLQADAPNDDFWTEDSTDVRDKAETQDLFGQSVAAGDFNGDGFDDLAIGVPKEAAGGDAEAGQVAILYGTSDGLQASAPDDQVWNQDSTDVNDSTEPGDHFGDTVVGGDFNGDGFDDLAIGVPDEDVGSIVDAGQVAILYGTSGGLQAAAPVDQVWNQDSTGVKDVAEAADGFGRTRASGDYNGDGFADLAIGVSLEDIGTIDDAGAVNVLYGSSGGLQADAPDDQFWNQDSSGVQNQADTGDRFGVTRAAGDFNGDGFDDLAIGVPYEDTDGIADSGAVSILYGSGGGLQADAPNDQLWSQNSSSVQGSAEVSDRFGSTVSGGDFNGDGFDDLMVGEPLENVGTLADAGSANVLYGSSGGLQADAPDDQLWDQDSPGVRGHADSGDRLGAGRYVGDFDGDGFLDLAIDVPFEDVGSVTDAGQQEVLYGTAAGLQADSPNDQSWDQDTAGVRDTAETNDQF